MAERLEGHAGITSLLEEHEIGFHSSSHSVHPTIFEYTDVASYEKAYEIALVRETSHINPLNGQMEGKGGIFAVRSILGDKEIVAYRAPGFCWSPPHTEALRDLGVKFDFSSILAPTPVFYKGLTFYQSSYGAIHDLTLGVQWKGQKEKALFKVSEGGTVLVPNSSFSIRVLKYAHQVDNFGEGGQVVLFKPNQQPKAFWLIRNLPQFDQQRGDDFVLTIEEVVEKEYTGLQVAKDPGVWVVWIGCALLILGLIISFFFSHQRVWVRIPKGPGREIVLAGSTSKNRVGFEKVFGQLADGIRSIK